MKRAVSAGVVMSVLMLLSPAWADPSAPSPAALCPADAIVYLETAPLADVRRDLDAFGNAAVPQFYPMGSIQIDGFMATPLGRQIDMTRPLGMAITFVGSEADGEPVPRPVFFIPVIDGAAFQAALAGQNPRQPCAIQSGYALLTEPGGPPPAGPAGAPPAFASRGDVRLVVDIERLRTQHGAFLDAQIAQARELMLLQVSMQPGRTPEQADQSRRGAEWAFDFMIDLYNQARGVEISVDLSASAAQARALVRAQPGSALEGFFLAQPSGLGTLHTLLPSDAWVVASANVSLGSLRTGILDAIRSICGEGPAAAGQCAAVEAWLSHLGDEVAYGYLPRLPLDLVGVARTPSAVTTDTLRDLASNSGFLRFQEVPAATASGTAVYDMTADAAAMPGATPESIELSRAMYGDPIHIAAAPRPDRIVLAMGSRAVARASEMLDREATAVAAGPAWFGTLASQLPSGCNYVTALDLIQAILVGGDVMSRTQGMPANPFEMVARTAPAPVAIFARFPEGGCEIGWHIPSSSVATVSMIAPMLMMAGASAGPGAPPGGGFGPPPPRPPTPPPPPPGW